MSIAPSVRTDPKPRTRVLASTVRLRQIPSASRLLRRRRMIWLTKLLLPATALALLSSLALWPELQREAGRAQEAAKAFERVHGDTVIGARYRSVDERGRPYTLTAASARQVSDDLIDLTEPKGDTTLENGTWLLLQAHAAKYRQRENALDLSHGVTLYRDDGTTLVTSAATVDLKNGAAAGAEPVHADGPFGKLDASGGFTATDKGEQIFFAGPAHLVLNGSNGP